MKLSAIQPPPPGRLVTLTLGMPGRLQKFLRHARLAVGHPADAGVDDQSTLLCGFQSCAGAAVERCARQMPKSTLLPIVPTADLPASASLAAIVIAGQHPRVDHADLRPPAPPRCPLRWRAAPRPGRSPGRCPRALRARHPGNVDVGLLDALADPAVPRAPRLAAMRPWWRSSL